MQAEPSVGGSSVSEAGLEDKSSSAQATAEGGDLVEGLKPRLVWVILVALAILVGAAMTSTLAPM